MHPNRTQAQQAFDRIRPRVYLLPAVCSTPTLCNHNKLSKAARGLIHLSIIRDSFINCILCHLAGLQHTVSTLFYGIKVWGAGLNRDMINCKSFK